MNGIPFILSLAYRDQIDEVCKSLPTLGLKQFVMYLIFNNGSTFVLSNVYPILKTYYQESLYREDYTYTPSLLRNDAGYYFCNEGGSVSDRLRKILAEKHNIYPIYNIVRHHTECTFVFSAIRDLPIEDEKSFYSKTIKKFESFCINFVDHFIDIIITHNPVYRHSFIFVNKQLRDSVIRGDTQLPTLSLRETECLWLAAQGKTSKQIAQVLNMSPFTVDKRLQRVREALHCNTLIEAIIESIHRGIIGNVNPFINHSNSCFSSITENFARPHVSCAA